MATGADFQTHNFACTLGLSYGVEGGQEWAGIPRICIYTHSYSLINPVVIVEVGGTRIRLY